MQGYEKIAIPANILLYLGNTRYSYSSYNGRLMLVCCLSNGAIFNDIERPLTQISRSRHYLTLNIS